MPYTLMKGLGWFLAALLLGVVIGWLLRSIAATRQMRKLRATRADHTELDRLVAERDRLVAERDRLVAERDRLVAELATRPSGEADPPGLVVAPLVSAALVDDSVDLALADADVQTEIESDLESDLEPSRPGEDDVTAVPEFTELNLVAAAAVIGKKIKLDDLTAIEGIGPTIVTLCHNIGIHTWADMASTEVSLLRTMLADAGPRFQMHAPASWPEQAGLLATGQWEAFTTLIASPGSGRPSE